MTDLIILPPAARYLRKLKDKKLLKLFKQAIRDIQGDPALGEKKHGDLSGVLSYDIYYNKTNYELAYTVKHKKDISTGRTITVVIIMAGTRENFYKELHRYWK